MGRRRNPLEQESCIYFYKTLKIYKKFVDSSDRLSISVLPNEYSKELQYLGTASGRDEDKIAKANLTVKEYEDVPYFEEGRLIFICRKLYAQNLKSG